MDRGAKRCWPRFDTVEKYCSPVSPPAHLFWVYVLHQASKCSPSLLVIRALENLSLLTEGEFKQ